MSDKLITLRVQGREGTKRLQLPANSSSRSLFEKIHEVFSFSSYTFQVHKDRKKSQEILSSVSKSLFSYGIKHGDMLYVSPLSGYSISPMEEPEPMQMDYAGTSNALNSVEEPIPCSSSSIRNGVLSRKGSATSVSKIGISNSKIEEDSVDEILNSQSGLIKRSKDPKMCRHNDNGCCVFCAPLEPYDEGYLKDHNIKHLSFHSFLKKLASGADKGKFVALEDLSCKIKEGCTSHLPWPKGICSKCQPSAVTLNRQTYRHIDNVMFESPQIVERFLTYWRATGNQRMGYLIGTYESHSDAPLGIRARVCAIYEPPQESTRDSINFLYPDDREEIVEQILSKLGLRKVGWIFTDLVPLDVTKGTVKHTRGIHSYFLSAQECITAAYFQNAHPNPCKKSPRSGYFGSKFATVVVTGDNENQVHMVGYQVSNQCMALVRDECLIPTNAPELGYVMESSEKQYVPDVYYKEKDEYGNEVTRLSRPLPVEYLLVDVPVSTPKEPMFTFKANKDVPQPFPIENRLIEGKLQDFHALSSYLGQFSKEDSFLKISSDFHFLVFVCTMDIVPIRDDIDSLLEAIKNDDDHKANDWAKSDHWATIEQLVSSSRGVPSQSMLPDEGWTCSHCTFINQRSSQNCEVCQLPSEPRQ